MGASAILGIDLGTSNTVLAVRRPESASKVSVLPLLQRTSATTVEERALLPSCLYSALPGELEPLPELEGAAWSVGLFARQRGIEAPSRLVTSSKSWLCHPRVDRHAAILPWGLAAQEASPRLSPVAAATLILNHVKLRAAAAGLQAELCEVVLTVPASFDEVARELTLEAAGAAGLSVRLLEEPQAALYVALESGALAPLRERLLQEDRRYTYLLVCDVGGGTTDLSLFRVELGVQGLAVTRTAVGAHLLLGGDNMDLALAHHLEPSLSAEEPLESAQFASLVASCQRAKETLLSGAKETIRISVAGRGSSLIGSTKSTTLTQKDAERLVLDGFFPKVARATEPARTRAGLVAMGLPFERDPAITRHVASFLERHLPAGESLGALLLNGGVFRAQAIVGRLLESFASWYAQAPLLIEGHDPDTAVALGAVHYARALRGELPRIEGGAARSYFLKVGTAAGGTPLLMCVVPKGTTEGLALRASDQTLKLLVGRPARFELYSSDVFGPVPSGQLVPFEPDFDKLPPLSVTVARAGAASELPVQLEAELSPIGTLELTAISLTGSGDRYRLAFDLRAEDSQVEPEAAHSRHLGKDLDRALELVSSVYGKGTSSEAKDAKNVLRELSRLLGEKETWNLDVARTLCDRVLSHKKGRRRSLDHERVFFQLAGFTARPGYGAPGDEERAAQIAPLFNEGLAFPKEARSWQQLFICFRRVAGGLPEKLQLQLRDTLAPLIAPSELKLKRSKTFKPESSDYEMLELLSHLERTPARERAELGDWILERTWTKRDPRLWAALGRIGARVPTYAEFNHVVSSKVAEKWLDHLLREKWADLPTAPRAAAEIARLTGDRSRDLALGVRNELAARLKRESADPLLSEMVLEVVPVAAEERGVFQGERLPPGLRL